MRVFVALSVLIAVAFGSTEVVRVETEVVRSNLTCPEGAVCADTFEYTQTDEVTGEAVPKRRRVVNCLCEGRGGCPNLKRHTLHASPRHRQQICVARNSLSRCKNGDIAEEMHVDSELFNGKSYYKMNCRCRRHRHPIPNGGFRERATELHGQVFEDDHWVHNYVCVRSRRSRRNK